MVISLIIYVRPGNHTTKAHHFHENLIPDMCRDLDFLGFTWIHLSSEGIYSGDHSGPAIHSLSGPGKSHVLNLCFNKK